MKILGQLSKLSAHLHVSLAGSNSPGTGRSSCPSSLHTPVQAENSLSFLGDKEQS